MKLSFVLKRTGQIGVVLGILAGLLYCLAGETAEAQQAAPGIDAADRAYREVAAKDYAAAIEDFREALAADPSKTPWRTDLAYACVSAGQIGEAAAEFTVLYREHPDDFSIALELGYLSQQLHQEANAVHYFQDAQHSSDARIAGQARNALAVLKSSQLTASKQKAYDLLAQGHRQEAISLFEAVHQDDPADTAAALQLGYLYAAAGEKAKARQMFEAERDNADPKVAAQAAAALDQLRRDSKFWFGSLYGSPFYQSRFSNEINPFNAKIGLRLDRYVQPYVGLRFSRDVRSRSGTLPQIFSDNSAVLSVGLQSTIAAAGITFYAEAGTAVSLLAQPSNGRAIPDYRAGLFWSRSWGTGLAEAARSDKNAISQAGSGYADLGFYSRYDNNAIGSLQLREGLNLPTARVVPVQISAVVNLVKDSNGVFYNNTIEVGPELRIAPLRQFPSLLLEAQFLRGFYAVHDPANPYRPRYGDVRLFLIWSKNF